MRKVFLSLCTGLIAVASYAQSPVIIQKDPEIEKMMTEVSPDSLKSYITTLVKFGTRNTLSTQRSATRGIGAARTWVLSKFNQFAKSSGGR